jgi:hypothetical protein
MLTDFKAVVGKQAPDHAEHTQEYIRTTKSTDDSDTVEVRCSCPGRVGLTLVVPRGHAPAKPAKKEAKHD